jgi:hypothetical protein
MNVFNNYPPLLLYLPNSPVFLVSFSNIQNNRAYIINGTIIFSDYTG